MNMHPVKVGDTGGEIEVILERGGKAVDLTSAQKVEFCFVAGGVTTKRAMVKGLAMGLVSYHWVAADFVLISAKLNYDCYYLITWTTGMEEAAPTEGKDIIKAELRVGS